jgi:hypothetical protein
MAAAPWTRAVAPCSSRWWFVGGAVRHLLGDLGRQPADAGELWRLRTDPAWLDQLTQDRYLSRTDFERRYEEAFPEARFQSLGAFHTMLWTRLDGGQSSWGS